MRVSAPEIKWTSDNPPLLITAEKAIYEEMWKAQTMGGHPSEQQEYFVKPIFRVEVHPSEYIHIASGGTLLQYDTILPNSIGNNPVVTPGHMTVLS